MDKASEALALAGEEERRAVESLKKSESDKADASEKLIVMRGDMPRL